MGFEKDGQHPIHGMLTEVLACDNAVMLGMEPKPC